MIDKQLKGSLEMNRQEMFEFAKNKFENQTGLYLDEILAIDGGKFIISPDNKLGLSMASLKLELSKEEHGTMFDFLTLVSSDQLT